ncbi:MAG: NAD(P)/FAD-dependent oxidoreductase [Rhizomicrobium sp.]
MLARLRNFAKNMPEHIVIIGAGQAGAQAVQSLRAEGFHGRLTLVGDEPFAPYQRPPLSKAYLLGTFARERLFLKSEGFFREAGCELILGTRALAIDRQAKIVKLGCGRRLGYDKLLLATGTRVRRLRCAGADLPGLHYLRGIADVDRLQPKFKTGARLAVVGGGYIGLEVAAVGAKRGLKVMVFEAAARLMQRTVSSPVADFYAREHEKAGVFLKLSTHVEGFEGDVEVRGLRAAGVFYPADIIVIGIGVVPNDELATAAGLPTRDGIVVNRNAMTDDPAIFAAGDCTRHHGHDGTEIRLECVQNAIDQARHAALAMLGKAKAYGEVPWFWSDQYDLKLQIAGLARPSDRTVLRGSPSSRKFAVFHLRDGILAAVEAVNAAPEYMMGRRMIADGARISSAKLADTSISIKALGECRR